MSPTSYRTAPPRVKCLITQALRHGTMLPGRGQRPSTDAQRTPERSVKMNTRSPRRMSPSSLRASSSMAVGSSRRRRASLTSIQFWCCSCAMSLARSRWACRAREVASHPRSPIKAFAISTAAPSAATQRNACCPSEGGALAGRTLVAPVRAGRSGSVG